MSLDATTEAVISLMPCKSFAETLTFYRALGFTVTHEQEDPYVYIAVKKGGIEIHLSGSLGVYNAKNSFGACLVFVPAVEACHCEYADALRTQYGKLPVAGIPRLLRPRKKFGTVRCFTCGLKRHVPYFLVPLDHCTSLRVVDHHHFPTCGQKTRHGYRPTQIQQE